MDIKLRDEWKKVLQSEFEQEYFTSLTNQVRTAYLSGPVYPPPKQVFNALELVAPTEIKVVILGQDPYHGPGQAHGLSFSVPDATPIPPSLKNIYKEIETDIGTPVSDSGNLERWARQGVLLLNATLTVEKSKPGSHQGLGWEQFTDAVIKAVSDSQEHIIFLLWGNFARSKKSLIDESKHLILEAPHPSPFSAHTGFFGCKHFSQTNDYLKKYNKNPIAW